MNIFSALNSPSKILAALALPLVATVSLHASAGDIPVNDPTAPCGALKHVGENTAIYNKSNFTFNVIFETSPKVIGPFRRVNAGAVKYLSDVENSPGIWKDTGETTHSYVVPVGPNSVVPIAYCADTSNGEAFMKGKVSFESEPTEGVHNIPDSGVDFFTNSWSSIVINRTHLFTPYSTPYVDYNVEPSLGRKENGSMVICPKDMFCKIK